MPLPHPNKDEKEGDFISRCMSSDVMKAEYKDGKQRLAVCYSLWRRERKAEGEASGDDGRARERGLTHNGKLNHLNAHARAIGDDSKSGKHMGLEAMSLEAAIRETLPREPDKDARRLRWTESAELAAKAPLGAKADPGWIEGYAVTWDNVDQEREVMRRGAFAKSIEERVPANKVKLMVRHFAHQGDVLDVVGTVTQMREDEHGLWFHAKLCSDPLSQSVRVKVQEGHVEGLSIGYGPVRWNYITLEDGTRILEHLECKVYEVTLTVKPVNELCRITAAKSLKEMAGGLEEVAKNLGLDAEAPDVDEMGRLLQNDVDGRDAVEALAKAVDTLASRVNRLLGAVSQDTPYGADLLRMDAELEARKLELARALAPEEEEA